MNDLAAFEAHRRHLFAVGYRMLGSAAEAEELVQEAWIRWSAEPEVRAPRAWLTAVVTRLALDALGSARARREVYPGPWLPEPILDVDADAELTDRARLSYGTLALLEQLAPNERVVWVLHEALDVPFAEIAGMIGKTEANCRQIARRARERVSPTPAAGDPAQQQRIGQFLLALGQGDVAQVRAALTDDARWISDGGGEVAAASAVVRGRDRVARLAFGLQRRGAADLTYRFASVSGDTAFLAFNREGALVTVLFFAFEGDHIAAVRAVLAPSKLRRLAASLGGGVRPNSPPARPPRPRQAW